MVPLNGAIRLFLVGAVANFLIAAVPLTAAQQDAKKPDVETASATFPGLALGATNKYVTPDGFTHWRNVVNTGCSFSDHFFTLDIDADPTEMEEISLTMSNFDVDFVDPNNACSGGPEVDIAYFNGNYLGFLTGANNAWSVNTFTLSQAQVVQGTNDVEIDTDAPGTGCWCVGVGYIEVQAKVGFKVKDKEPTDSEKNRAFKASDVDLTVEFTTEYDPSTLTSSTFLLEYRNLGGGWVSVAGTFNPLSPQKFEFTPSADLKDGVRYRATVKSGGSGVKSDAGGELDSDEQWFFWTVPDLDITDPFSNDACTPESSPCNGLEVAVFQVARNANILFNKPAVARVYMRWKPHMDVLDSDQVKELTADVELTGGGVTVNAMGTLKRQDQITAADRRAAQNSINVYHTPTSGADYTVEVTPKPQSNAVSAKYTETKALGDNGAANRLTFDYHFLKDGNWDAAVPAAAKTRGRTLMTAGVLLTGDMFPVRSASYTEKADVDIGYTFPGTTTNEGSCGNVAEVDCPSLNRNISELRCVYSSLETMRGTKEVIAISVPNTLCPGATAFALGKVFMAQDGTGANDGTVSHELGHVFDISQANNPNTGHRNSNVGVEGFQVRTRINRSYVENRPTSESLMHTTLKPSGTQWIDNDDYDVLLTKSYSRRRLLPTGKVLIVMGEVDFDENEILFAPALLRDGPSASEAATGQCSVQLRDATEAVLHETFVDPGLKFTILFDGTSGSGEGGLNTFFSVSLDWDDDGVRVVMDCGGGIIGTIEKSANAPVVTLTSPPNAETLSGINRIEWTGTDPDGDLVSFQLEVSQDGGQSWSPQMPLSDRTSFDLDTRLLSNLDTILRVMASDGFNVQYDDVTVTIDNGLAVQTVFPPDGAIDVVLGSDVRASFSSGLMENSVATSTFQLRKGFASVAAQVTYDSFSRTVILEPQEPLEARTQYEARLTSGIRGANGESFSQFSWTFTTEADDMPPSVKSSVPAQGDTSVSINALVQVSFSEEINAVSLTTTEFQLLNSNGSVPTTLQYFTGDTRAILIPQNNLQENTEYTILVNGNVSDLEGNILDSPFEATFITGDTLSSGVRIIGNYEDSGVDEDGDGLFEYLDIQVDVEVLNPSSHNLNGRLLDTTGRLIGWTSTGNLFLQMGIHRLTLRFISSPIRGSGLDGPYTLDSLNFYSTANPLFADVRFGVFKTFPYNFEAFFAELSFGPIPDQLFEIGANASDVLNLTEFTSHISESLSSIRYEVQINTDPQLQVLIDSNALVSFIPTPGAKIDSEVTLEARDMAGNRADARFGVRFENATASRLEAEYDPEMSLSEEQTISFDIFDQFGRLFIQPVTVELSTTLGVVSPANVSTSTGEFSVVFSSDTNGTAFVTAATSEASTTISIRVIDDAEPVDPTDPSGGLSEGLLEQDGQSEQTVELVGGLDLSETLEGGSRRLGAPNSGRNSRNRDVDAE